MHKEVEALVDLLMTLPGIGPKSAQRFALFLISKRQVMNSMSRALISLAQNIGNCTSCGNISSANKLCDICDDKERQKFTICIVEKVADLWAIEKNSKYTGIYHVLNIGGSDNVAGSICDIDVGAIVCKINRKEIQEIIIATNSTVSGQTIAYYLLEQLKHTNVKITRLAFGMPIGGEIEYMDEGTVSAAIINRKYFS